MTVNLETTLFAHWTPPRYPDWIERRPNEERRSWAHLYSFAARKAEQALAGGLDQLVPIIVVTGKDPQVLRKEMGNAVWRKIHRASTATNVKRATIWRYTDALTFADIVAIRPMHLFRLAKVRQWANDIELQAALYAGINAERSQFFHVRMLWIDTERMGGHPKPVWSVRRLGREHDRLARAAILTETDPTPFTEPQTLHAGDFRFTRLISAADLALEGHVMRHCIASYAEAARRDEIAVFRVEGADKRATFAFSMASAWRELKGFANASVSRDLQRAADDVRKAFGALAADAPGRSS